MDMAAMLVMWPRSFEQLFFPKRPGCCIWNLVAIGPIVSEKKSFEIVDGRRTDDGRTTEPAYTISCPGAFGSGELKKHIIVLSVKKPELKKTPHGLFCRNITNHYGKILNNTVKTI